jgi:hypothetical protein
VSYSDVVEMQASQSLMKRAMASVAEEVTSGNSTGDAVFIQVWVQDRSWDIASTPGWDAKWASGVAAGIADPGDNPAVIADADILPRIQQLLATYPLPETPEPPPGQVP